MTIFPKQCYFQNVILMLKFFGRLFKNNQQIRTAQALAFSNVCTFALHELYIFRKSRDEI